MIDAETRQLTPVKDMRLYFVRSGEVVQRVEAMADGKFIARRLPPAVYSLIGAGPDGFIAYSMQVLPPLSEDNNDTNGALGGARHRPEQPPQLAIDAIAVPPSNFGAIRKLIRAHVPSGAEVAKREEAATDAIPAEARSVDDPVADMKDYVPATSIRSHQIRLQPDGRLLGRVRRQRTQTGRPLAVRQVQVFLVQDDIVMARTSINESGVFAFDDVPAGVYSLVVVPREGSSTADKFHQGFAAFSIEVVPSEPDRAQAEMPQVIFVSFLADEPGGGEAPQVDVSLVNPSDFGALNNITGQELAAPGAAPAPVAAAPAAPGAGGAGSGGGGGGAGGGAGGAGAAAGGAAAAAAAAASQGSEPASPFAP